MRHINRLLVTAVAIVATGAVTAGPWEAQASESPVPGHRLVATSIPSANSVLAVETPDSTLQVPSTWQVNLATGTWEMVVTGPPGAANPGFLVHLPGRAAAYFIGGWPPSVWVLDLHTRAWTQPAVPTVHPDGLTDVVPDARRARILGWSDPDDRMWTYDPATNTWSAVRRTSPWPTTAMPDGSHGYSLMTYDTVADAAVLAILPVPGRPGQTWLFDPQTRTWERRRATPPPMMFGYGEWGTEAVYDPVHRRTVLFGDGTVALYDSGGDRWRVPDSSSWPSLAFEPGVTVGDDEFTPWPKGLPVGALARTGHQLVMHEPSGHVVLLGGLARFRKLLATAPWDVRIGPVRALWSYDVGENSWTRVSTA